MKFSKIKHDQQELTDVNYIEFNKKLINNRSIQKIIHCLNQTQNIFTHFILKSKFMNQSLDISENELKILSIRCKYRHSGGTSF